MHLQVTLLNLVAKHLNPSEIGSLKESFLAMDVDGSGYLDVRTPLRFWVEGNHMQGKASSNPCFTWFAS